MRVAIAYPAFIGSFREFFPDIEQYQSGKKYDLVIFSGGEDINPRIYGEKNTHSDYDDNRDNIEVRILNEILDTSLPSMPYVLGVCRGHQLISARLGLHLIQDLKEILGKPHQGYHTINSIEGTVAQEFFKTSKGDVMVNSMHHQGVSTHAALHSGIFLKTTAEYLGVSEFSESKKFLTLQSHPEFSRNVEFFDWIKTIITGKDSFYKPSSNITINTDFLKQEQPTKSTKKEKTYSAIPTYYGSRKEQEFREYVERRTKEMEEETKKAKERIDSLSASMDYNPSIEFVSVDGDTNTINNPKTRFEGWQYVKIDNSEIEPQKLKQEENSEEESIETIEELLSFEDDDNNGEFFEDENT